MTSKLIKDQDNTFKFSLNPKHHQYRHNADQNDDPELDNVIKNAFKKKRMTIQQGCQLEKHTDAMRCPRRSRGVIYDRLLPHTMRNNVTTMRAGQITMRHTPSYLYLKNTAHH